MSSENKLENKLDDFVEFNDEFLDNLIESLGNDYLKDGFSRAKERRRKRISDIGYPAYRAEYEQKKHQLLVEAAQHDESAYVKHLLKISGLGKKFFARTFNTFKANPDNEHALNICVDIASGKKQKGVILSGDHGIGKTHLAAAIVNNRAKKGRAAYFGNIVDIKAQVMDSFRSGTDRVINKFLKCELMVIDDLGAEHSKNDSTWIEELLYKIVNRAYEGNKTLVITTNLGDREFTDRYGQRISSRLYEMCEWVSYTDKDRRTDFMLTDEQTPFVPYKD